MCLHLFAFYRSLSLDLMSHTRVVDASDRPVPKSLVQFTSSNFGSPNGCGSDLDGMGTRHFVTVDEKLDALLSQFAQFKEQVTQIPTFTDWMPRMESHVSTAPGGFAVRLTEMEQNFSTLTARLCKVETHAASESNVTGSARSWPSLEQANGSTATGSHGPGSSDDNRNTRRKLDIFCKPRR